MDRETILEKSRKEQVDEGALYMKQKGASLSVKICTGLTIFYMVFMLFFSITRYEMHCVMSIYWGVYSGEWYYKYKFSGKKGDKTAFIGSVVACVGFGLVYVLSRLFGE